MDVQSQFILFCCKMKMSQRSLLDAGILVSLALVAVCLVSVTANNETTPFAEAEVQASSKNFLGSHINRICAME